MTLSDRLRELRRSRKWSQQHLRDLLSARGLSLSRTAISSYERRGVTPAISTLRELAALYGLGPSEEFVLYRLAASSEAAASGPEQLHLVAPPKGSDAA